MANSKGWRGHSCSSWSDPPALVFVPCHSKVISCLWGAGSVGERNNQVQQGMTAWGCWRWLSLQGPQGITPRAQELFGKDSDEEAAKSQELLCTKGCWPLSPCLTDYFLSCLLNSEMRNEEKSFKTDPQWAFGVSATACHRLHVQVLLSITFPRDDDQAGKGSLDTQPNTQHPPHSMLWEKLLSKACQHLQIFPLLSK